MTDAEFETLLPKLCYVVVPGAAPGKRIGIVKRGEKGYYLTDFDTTMAPEERVEEAVKMMNERLKVSAAQSQAMLIGSMFGWNVFGADPRMAP